MTFLTELWLPILLAAVFVFIASSILHMALPWHCGDMKKLPGEDALVEALRANNVPPGAYMFPMPDSMKDWKTPEMQAKMKQGPIGWMTVVPGGWFNMGRSLGQWFAYCLLVGVFVAYVGWNGLGVEAPYLTVFRVTGAAAVLGYALGYFHNTIWKGERWVITIKFIIDGVIYALLTAGTFAWLWPEG
jgi:hypothetical protein